MVLDYIAVSVFKGVSVSIFVIINLGIFSDNN